MDPDPDALRLELTLKRPTLWFGPKPTVVIGGRGQPAQWGTGTWVVGDGDSIGVYLFNRLWRYGQADLVVERGALNYDYRPPLLPLGRGRLAAR